MSRGLINHILAVVSNSSNPSNPSNPVGAAINRVLGVGWKEKLCHVLGAGGGGADSVWDTLLFQGSELITSNCVQGGGVVLGGGVGSYKSCPGVMG